MSSARESSAFPIKILLLVLGIVGVVVLVIVLGCAGVIYRLWTKVVPEFQALQTASNAFVEDIHTGQFQSAYGRTSAGFQARQTFPQFQAFVAQYPALSNYTSMTCSGLNVSSTTGGTQGTVRYTVVGPNNSLSFTLILVQQNGQWRVDSFTVP
ncbi:MAG TPA: hypothetical protein VE999_22290 [Gemmataceae bacterium]|nr:hypothetical protein [Gemmataceae bacterium]